MVKLLRDPSPPFHPPSQPHIMMVAYPPHCPTSLPMTALPSLLPLLNFWGKTWGKGDYFKTIVGQNGRLCSSQTNWKWNERWQKLIGSPEWNWRNSLNKFTDHFFIGYRWQQPRRCSLRWKDRTEMDCWTVAACKRDGYVALLPIYLHPTAQVLRQELCSKEME